MGNDGDYRKQVGIDYHPMTNLTRSTRVEKLPMLKTTNTRDYWKILNSEIKKSNCKAPLNALHDFFKNIIKSTL